MIRPKKIKALFAFSLKIGRVCRAIFFFFFFFTYLFFFFFFTYINLDTEEIIHVCSFLGMQSPRIGLLLVLEVSCIPLYLVKVPFWDSYYVF